MTERPERPASAARRVDEQSVDARIRAAGAPDRDHQHPVAITERLAGAPISWGACEVPGWGAMPDADEVLAEMAQLGLRGTELGALGFLPRDSTLLKRLLERHRLALVG